MAHLPVSVRPSWSIPVVESICLLWVPVPRERTVRNAQSISLDLLCSKSEMGDRSNGGPKAMDCRFRDVLPVTPARHYTVGRIHRRSGLDVVRVQCPVAAMEFGDRLGVATGHSAFARASPSEPGSAALCTGRVRRHGA